MSKSLKIILFTIIAVIVFIAGVLLAYPFIKGYNAHHYENDKAISVPDSDAYTPKYK